jgi:hypothetical protein
MWWLFNILLKKIKNETCWANLGAIYNNGPSILLDINLQEDNVEYVMPYIVTGEKKKKHNSFNDRSPLQQTYIYLYSVLFISFNHFYRLNLSILKYKIIYNSVAAPLMLPLLISSQINSSIVSLQNIIIVHLKNRKKD